MFSGENNLVRNSSVSGQGVKDITIIYDYYGIEKWATGEWKAKKKCKTLQPNMISSRQISEYKIYQS